MTERASGPTPLRPPIHHYLVAEDSLQHACLLVSALSGRITTAQACQAIGCTPMAFRASVVEAGLAGEALAKAAIDGNFRWQGLWAYHARQVEAQGRPASVVVHPATQKESPS